MCVAPGHVLLEEAGPLHECGVVEGNKVEVMSKCVADGCLAETEEAPRRILDGRGVNGRTPWTWSRRAALASAGHASKLHLRGLVGVISRRERRGEALAAGDDGYTCPHICPMAQGS